MYCRVRKPQKIIPEMAALPQCRLEPYNAPFSHTGIDFFGPFEIKIGRRREKRYGVLFTCMTVRAVHLELAANLTTDSTILALRRMISRRGQPLIIFSDRGTNLRGADRELRDAMEEINFDDLSNEFIQRGITWIFNPPAASHMGGAWERLIRSVRVALRVSLKERAPKEEVLHTLLTEAEHLINSRPLTIVSEDANELESITPNHILIQKSNKIQLPGVFTSRDEMLTKQWRIAQYLTDLFWKRWLKEYLPTLVRRQKWFKSSYNLKVNDIVRVADMQNIRGVWPIGIITNVYSGSDNVVRIADVKTATGVYQRPTVKLHKINLEVHSVDDPLINTEGRNDV